MDNPPPYSPEFNAIEMAFSKLKAILQKAAARTIDDLTPTECRNYSAATGNQPEQIESALAEYQGSVIKTHRDGLP